MWFHHIAYTRDSTYVISHLVVNLAPRNCNHSPPPSQQLLLPFPFMGASRSIHKHLQSYRNFHTPPNPRTHAHHIHALCIYQYISPSCRNGSSPRKFGLTDLSTWIFSNSPLFIFKINEFNASILLYKWRK